MQRIATRRFVTHWAHGFGCREQLHTMRAEECTWNLTDASFSLLWHKRFPYKWNDRKLLCSINFQRYALLLSTITDPLGNNPFFSFEIIGRLVVTILDVSSLLKSPVGGCHTLELNEDSSSETETGSFLGLALFWHPWSLKNIPFFSLFTNEAREKVLPGAGPANVLLLVHLQCTSI